MSEVITKIYPILKPKKYELATIKILELIINNKIKTGYKLPDGSSLAEKLKISKPTLKQAYDLLKAVNILDIRHGVGIFLKDIKLNQVENFIECFNHFGTIDLSLIDPEKEK